jgi:hypothetical protein
VVRSRSAAIAERLPLTPLRRTSLAGRGGEVDRPIVVVCGVPVVRIANTDVGVPAVLDLGQLRSAGGAAPVLRLSAHSRPADPLAARQPKGERDRRKHEAHSLKFGAVSITLVVKEIEASKAFPRRMFRLSDVAMDSENLLPISQLERAHFRDSHVVRTLIQQIVLLKDAGQRRVALRDLVARLIAADELETAVCAARLAPDLTPLSFMNNVDPFLKAELLLTVVDQLLEQQHFTRATQLLDEARLCRRIFAATSGMICCKKSRGFS